MQVNHSLWDVCQQYFGEGIALPIFVIALICLIRKWNKEKQVAFFATACASVLLVYNEVTYRLLDVLGEGSTYYRFFWICPIVLVIAYFVIELVWNAKKRQQAWLILVICVAGYMSASSQLTNWIALPDNIYQLDDDVIQIADAIMVQTDGEETTLIDDGTLSDTIRQYNAKINFTELYTHQINQVLYSGRINYLGRYVQDYISLNESEYIAIEKEKIGTSKVLESAGCKRVAETDGYYLYHVNHDAIDDDWFMLLALDEGVCTYSNIEYIPVSGLQNEYRYVYISDFGAIENEAVYEEIIAEINSLDVKGVFINARASENSDWTLQYEDLLKELEVPYYSNDKSWQIVEAEDVIFCMIDNMSDISEEVLINFENLKSEGKPVIMILSSKLATSDELYGMIAEEDSPVIQILTVEKENSEKTLINDSFLQYATPVDDGQMLNVISVSGLEE